ncbi:unnamed protein product [Anisakis simplex]|uniref:Uncharacterized protein n=1 Tax=Anisakis simplex TaxID=6269 RepID=A0A0M3J288_ANISI|nr:unnamed protein product [Anisakis simplex]
MERKFLRPNKMRPSPLEENFWEAELERERAKISLGNGATETERAYAKDCEFGREIAPVAVNITGNQYENLISLSFDQDELLRREEMKRERVRKNIINNTLYNSNK